MGNIDRSPCGTGTSAKLAVRVAKGELALGDEFIHQSLVGSIFRCQVPETVEIKTDAGVIEGVIPVIAGDAFITGMGSVIINEKDPQTYGFRMG